MSKYIDAEKLKKIVEQAKQRALKGAEVDEDMYCDGRADAFCEVLLEIDSLQQEVPEVDLDYQMFAKEMDAVFNLPKEITENTEENPLNWEYVIARHFYELGLKARKEE